MTATLNRHEFRAPLIAAVVTWFVIVAAGSVAMIAYGTAPAMQSDVPQRWPANSTIARDPDGLALVMFVHPHCPCTTASLVELRKSLGTVVDPPRPTIVFVAPPGTPDGWHAGRLWDAVAADPGLDRHLDVDGREAQRLRATTSGQVLAFSGSELAFSGGITPSRGHEGGSHGGAALRRLLAAQSPPRTRTPVFGCPLLTTMPTPSCRDTSACCGSDAHDLPARALKEQTCDR